MKLVLSDDVDEDDWDAVVDGTAAISGWLSASCDKQDIKASKYPEFEGD